MKKIVLLAIVAFVLWNVFGPKPSPKWKGNLVSEDPIQSNDIPGPWTKNGFSIQPRAKYHIKGILLSKHHYGLVLDEEDKISPYDFALGWGPMSNAKVINALDITQSGRWYEYRWSKEPPIVVDEIVSHSSNNHLIPDNADILRKIESVKRFEVVELEGYLVDVTQPNGWSWHTSLSRTDVAGGSCEVLWVTKVEHYPTILN